jgi:hypothetical protein
MSKCHFIVLKKTNKKNKKNPNKQTSQTKTTPHQNTPEFTNRCKQTQMQDQPFSVAVVADDSHCSIIFEVRPEGAGARAGWGHAELWTWAVILRKAGLLALHWAL